METRITVAFAITDSLKGRMANVNAGTLQRKSTLMESVQSAKYQDANHARAMTKISVLNAIKASSTKRICACVLKGAFRPMKMKSAQNAS